MELDIFSMVFFGSTLFQWLLFFVSIGVAIIIGKLLELALVSRLKKLAKESTNRFDDILIDVLEKPFLLLFAVAGLFVGSSFLVLNGENIVLFNNIFGVAATIVVTWIVIRIVDAVIKGYVVPITEATGSKVDDQLLPVISKAAKIIVIALALVMIASNFGYDVTAIIAGLGIGGLAIAFAAQATLADVFAGLSIFASKPFVVGDFVDINGRIMKAEQIGLRYSRFRDLDGRLVTIPNSKVAGVEVINITSEPTRKTLVNIAITYSTPAKKIAKAKKILKEIIESEERCEKNPIIAFSEFKDYSLNILLIYYIKDKANFIFVRDAINTKIKEMFEREKISFAFPSQTIYLEK